ncbi:WD40-repeat-containing domain protein [Chytridium lagenaria]|nr:WD40-repeat-containing domain protein [Chytridium lagenaria]
MKVNYQFSNLCGTVYKKGNIAFSTDGNAVISPVGNKISVFELTSNKSYTFPFENRKDTDTIALSPNGLLMLSIDEDGRAILANVPRRVVLHRHNFGERVRSAKFSPNGKYIAITHGKLVQFWRTPGFTVEFSPMVLHRTISGPYDEVSTISWSPDSSLIVAGCRDMTLRIMTPEPSETFRPFVLTGHRDVIMGAWFSASGDQIFSVGRDGSLFKWKATLLESRDGDESDEDSKKARKKRRVISQGKKWYGDSDHKWVLDEKHYFNQNHSKVSSVDYNSRTNIVVVGFHSGVFGIWELTDFSNVHILSISQSRVDTVSINPSGEWLAFGCSKFGQLLVWEWQSESYVLKQQGHHHHMNCIAYSQDGQYIVTGGDDGKVKLWNTQTGFCFVTFSEHTGPVRAVEFTKKGQVVFSCSVDGTVRAFDMIRYRNFRTFTSPTPVQFSCLAVDESGELVCAGSLDTFEIFVWSVQTGKLLEILSGHKGPVSCLSFSPLEGRLVSGSWDKTVRTWDIFSRSMNPESFDHTSEVLSLAFRPDGKHLAVASLDGMISFWDVDLARQVGYIDGRMDIAGGRKSTDRVTSANALSGKHFTSICYTSDGSGLMAGSNSKYVCIYNVSNSLLLKRFQITNNLSLDGMHDQLDSRNMTEAGPRDLLDQDGDQKSFASDDKKCKVFSEWKDMGSCFDRRTLLYSLDDSIIFDPFDLEVDITPESIGELLKERKEFLKALVMALRLGERDIIDKIYVAIPKDEIAAIVKNLPKKYLEKVIRLIVHQFDVSPSVHQHLLWSSLVIRFHGQYLKDRSQEFAPSLRALTKCASKVFDALGKM